MEIKCECGNAGWENFEYIIIKYLKESGNPHNLEDYFINTSEPLIMDIVCKLCKIRTVSVRPK